MRPKLYFYAERLLTKIAQAFYPPENCVYYKLQSTWV